MKKRLSPSALSLLLLSIPGLAAPTSHSANTPTFNKDIAPIFYQHCVGCHQPNDIAPMSLLTYKEARAWAAAGR